MVLETSLFLAYYACHLLNLVSNYFSILLLLLLLLLAAMTYNQVQLVQIKASANHYVDIEITGCRVLYSKSIASSGVARLI